MYSHALRPFKVHDLAVACRCVLYAGASRFWVERDGLVWFITFDVRLFMRDIRWKVES